MTVHDLIFLLDPSMYKERYIKRPPLVKQLKHYLTIKYNALAILVIIRTADYIITDSELIKREIIELGYPKEKIAVINLGIDSRFIKTPIKKYLHSKFIIGYLGSFQRKKNVEFAVNAFKKFQEKYKGIDSVLELWGSTNTPEYEYIRSIVGNEKSIVFKGFAPEDKLVETYDRFDVAIFPILYTGFELEILEAQARGIPVIVYKNSKIPEEVRRYCFEAKDAEHASRILKKIKDRGYDQKLRSESMNYARSFTWEKMGEKTLETYKRVLGI